MVDLIEPSVFFFCIFSCIRRCARLGLGPSCAMTSSEVSCMRRSPHVPRRTRIDTRPPRGAGA